MVPCGLAGHYCILRINDIISNGSHTFHLRVFNLFYFLSIFLKYFISESLRRKIIIILNIF